MAVNNGLVKITLTAGEDMSSYQFCVVKMSGANVVKGTDGADGVGVLQNKPAASGDPATVGIAGVSQVLVSGTVTAGLPVSVADAYGRIANAVSGDAIIGIALETATTAGQKVSVLLFTAHQTL